LYRRGYTARPESLIASEDELKRDVADASASPVDLTGIPLTLKLTPEERRASSQGPRFMLAISASALQRADTPQGLALRLFHFHSAEGFQGESALESGRQNRPRVLSAGSRRNRQARVSLPRPIRRAGQGEDLSGGLSCAIT
jgi:hypothetical protein